MNASQPVVAIEGVHAADAAGPKGKPRGRLTGMVGSFGAGVHAILGGPEDGTLALAGLLAGGRAPTRGRVMVAGVDLRKLGSARARVGALDAEPRLPPASTVAGSVRAAMRARGEPERPLDSNLDPLGLSRLHARRLRSLSFAEARAVELALAISTPAPVLVALHEPFADVAIAETSVVRERLRDLAAAGVCVIVTTASTADARAVGDRIYALRGGTIAFDVPADVDLGDRATTAEIVAWVTPSASGDASILSLRARVAAAAEVVSVASEGGGGVPHVLRIRARSSEAAARALVAAALESDVSIDGFAPSTPALATVRAAADAILRSRFAAGRPPAGMPLQPVFQPPQPAPQYVPQQPYVAQAQPPQGPREAGR